MEHDAVISKFDGPLSHRIADVRKANEKFVEHSFEVMEQRIRADHCYESNSSGHFAWDMSLLIRAACLMWNITADPTHLKRAVRWSKHIMERTDESLGLSDWRGRQKPVWSAGQRYTAGVAKVGEISDVPVSIQAAADKIVIEKPSDSTAIVHIFKAGAKSWSSPESSLVPNDHNYLPDVLGRRSASNAALIRGLPAAIDLSFISAGEYDLEAQRAAHLVHTGLIARSLIAAGEGLVRSGSIRASSEVSPHELFHVAKSALLAHDHEIRIHMGRPWYITPEEFPTRRLGLQLPHNHVVDATTAFLILGKIEKDVDLANLGASMARRFLAEIDAYRRGELRHPWFYYPVDSDTFYGVTRDEPIAERSVPPVHRSEDASHATMRVRALAEWRHFDRSIVSDQQLEAVALAFRRYYMSSAKGISTLKWLPEDQKDSPRQGVSDTYVGAWGALAEWDPTIKRRINSMAYRHPPKAIFGATVLSAAEIIALNAGVPIYAS